LDVWQRAGWLEPSCYVGSRPFFTWGAFLKAEKMSVQNRAKFYETALEILEEKLNNNKRNEKSLIRKEILNILHLTK
jgi:hypothetical protein